MPLSVISSYHKDDCLSVPSYHIAYHLAASVTEPAHEVLETFLTPHHYDLAAQALHDSRHRLPRSQSQEHHFQVANDLRHIDDLTTLVHLLKNLFDDHRHEHPTQEDRETSQHQRLVSLIHVSTTMQRRWASGLAHLLLLLLLHSDHCLMILIGRPCHVLVMVRQVICMPGLLLRTITIKIRLDAMSRVRPTQPPRDELLHFRIQLPY